MKGLSSALISKAELTSLDIGYEKKRGGKITSRFGTLTTGSIVVLFTEIGKPRE